MKILFAGESIEVKRLLRVYVLNYEHKLTIVSNGLGCISCLRYDTPDLLVLDRSLLWGGSDGVLALMREELSESSIPVLLLSEVLKSNDCFSQKHANSRPKTPTKVGDLLHLKAFLEGMDISTTCLQPQWLVQRNNSIAERIVIESRTTKNAC